MLAYGVTELTYAMFGSGIAYVGTELICVNAGLCPHRVGGGGTHRKRAHDALGGVPLQDCVAACAVLLPDIARDSNMCYFRAGHRTAHSMSVLIKRVAVCLYWTLRSTSIARHQSVRTSRSTSMARYSSTVHDVEPIPILACEQHTLRQYQTARSKFVGQYAAFVGQ
eukprot:1334985-Rhodomonas_salina.2